MLLSGAGSDTSGHENQIKACFNIEMMSSALIPMHLFLRTGVVCLPWEQLFHLECCPSIQAEDRMPPRGNYHLLSEKLSSPR